MLVLPLERPYRNRSKGTKRKWRRATILPPQHISKKPPRTSVALENEGKSDTFSTIKMFCIHAMSFEIHKQRWGHDARMYRKRRKVFENCASRRALHIKNRCRDLLPKLGGLTITDWNGCSASSNERLKQVPCFINKLRSDDPKAQLEALKHFRILLSVDLSPPIDEVIAFGVVPIFASFLRNKNPKIQFEAAWCITNIASGSSQQTHEVVKCGAVAILIELLKSEHECVADQAVWALDNIAGDGIECRDYLLKLGIIQALLQLVTKVGEKVVILRNVTSCMANLVRGTPVPPLEVVQPMLPFLGTMLYMKDPEILQQSCGALAFLSEGTDNQRIQTVIESGVCRRLVELLLSEDSAVCAKALRVIGNIVTGDDLQTQVMLNIGALPCLVQLLRRKHATITKNVCWTLSNIAAGNREQIQALIECNAIPAVVGLCREQNFEIRKEAAWTIANITSGGSREQTQYIVRQGCVGPLCDILSDDSDKTISVGLEAVTNILRVGTDAQRLPKDSNQSYAQFVTEAGGLKRIEGLLSHANSDISQRASAILKKFYSDHASAAPSPASTAPVKRTDVSHRKDPKSSKQSDEVGVVEQMQKMKLQDEDHQMK